MNDGTVKDKQGCVIACCAVLEIEWYSTVQSADKSLVRFVGDLLFGMTEDCASAARFS